MTARIVFSNIYTYGPYTGRFKLLPQRDLKQCNTGRVKVIGVQNGVETIRDQMYWRAACC